MLVCNGVEVVCDLDGGWRLGAIRSPVIHVRIFGSEGNKRPYSYLEAAKTPTRRLGDAICL